MSANEMQVNLLAIIKILNTIEVKGQQNLVALMTSINELQKIANQLGQDQPKAE